MKEELLALLSRYMPGPFKVSGDNIVHRCPFHKGGQETNPSFGVNYMKGGVWNCYACHESGDLRQLLKALGAPRLTVDAEVSLLGEEYERQKYQHKLGMKNFFISRDPFKAPYVLPEITLSIYDYMPLKLVEKGFKPEILQKMEVGFDKVNNRITYPLRDIYGNLAGVSAGATLEGQWPKYKVYQGGHKEGSQWVSGDYGKWFDEEHPRYICENHNYLWNYNRVFTRQQFGMSVPVDTIYLVEGFKACLWMIQAGLKNTVAAMGSYLSESQQRMLHRFGGMVVLCFDNDDAGRRATVRVGQLLWKPLYGRLKVLRYPDEDDETQPDDYPTEQLRELAHQAVDFTDVAPLRRQQTNSSESKTWQ